MKTFFPLRAFRFIVSLLCILLAGCAAPSTTQAADALQTFELHDWLGHQWTNELVTYEIANKLYNRKDLALIGPDGKTIAYQWATDENGKQQIAFLADLPKFGRSTYRLEGGAPNAKTNLTVEETADTIRLSNGKTGVAIRKKLEAGQAPISGVLLNSGQWVGGSQLKSEMPVQSYQAKVVERGPVFAEVLCTADFGGGKNWRMRFRVVAGEPVVLVSEAADLGAQSSWRLSLSDNFAPTQILFRYGVAPVGKLDSESIGDKDGTIFLLEPWLRWWVQPREFTWLGLYNEGSNDLLALAACNPAAWVDPTAKTPQSPTQIPIVRRGDFIFADLPLTGGVRKWMLASLSKAASLQPLTDNTDKNKDVISSALPQQYLEKYSDFPLDAIKDYTLQWPGDESGHPRLLVTAKDVARFRKTYKADENAKKAILASLAQADAESPLEYSALQYYLGTGDKEVGRVLADSALRQVQNEVDEFLNQKYQATLGFAPHHRRGLLQAVTIADAVWSDILTPEEQTKIKAQTAFLGYTINRADYWSPVRGLAANPNMTTMVASYQTAYGSLLPDHPQAKAWVTAGMTELKNQMDGWSDENGGWLEAPHYAMVSFDYMLSPFLMAHNAGLNENLYNPRLKKIARWFAQISTPPDVNAEGIRHLPPLGNTYINEPSGEFGILASIWKEKDPQFAAEMQWMFQQQGSPLEPGVGGAYPAFAGYRSILLDSQIAPQKPDYKSVLFPQTGVLLRNGLDDRETQLTLIAGNNHSHYDDDSGSVTLWGKGRLIANDFGYNGDAPADQHSMIDSPAASGIMQVQTFESTPQFDYVRGGKGGWQRQIAFVKDSDMMAPSYFVLRDSMSTPAPATWRMWFTANKVTPGAPRTLVEGKDDVDTDVIFAAPTNLSLKTEEKSVTTFGLDSKRHYGKLTTTQTGLVVEVKNEDVLTVVYPRLKIQKPPIVTSLSDGRAVKIVSETGTDYVFLNDVPFTFKGDGIEFSGTSGLVKVRGDKAFIALGEGGELTAFGQTKEAPIPAAVQKLARSAGRALDADFEDGKQSAFLNSALSPKIHEGNPVAGDATHGGKYSVMLTLPENGNANISYGAPIFIDPAKKYRLSLKMYAPGKVGGTVGGYSASRTNAQLKTPDGKVWGWGVGFKGPMDGWTPVEATFGPPGSGVGFSLLPDAVSLSLTFWCSGTPSPIYVDDLVVEEMK